MIRSQSSARRPVALQGRARDHIPRNARKGAQRKQMQTILRYHHATPIRLVHMATGSTVAYPADEIVALAHHAPSIRAPRASAYPAPVLMHTPVIACPCARPSRGGRCRTPTVISGAPAVETRTVEPRPAPPLDLDRF